MKQNVLGDQEPKILFVQFTVFTEIHANTHFSSFFLVWCLFVSLCKNTLFQFAPVSTLPNPKCFPQPQRPPPRLCARGPTPAGMPARGHSGREGATRHTRARGLGQRPRGSRASWTLGPTPRAPEDNRAAGWRRKGRPTGKRRPGFRLKPPCGASGPVAW